MPAIPASLIQQYISIGAGGLSFLFILLILWYFVTKQTKLMQRIKEDSAVNTAMTTEVIKNNTEAVREMSRSNDNVAHALGLLDQHLQHMDDTIERHDKRAELIHENGLKVSANMTILSSQVANVVAVVTHHKNTA